MTSAMNADNPANGADPRMMTCDVCGKNHETRFCSSLNGLQFILDSPVQSRAIQSLPPNLKVRRVSKDYRTVIAKAGFPKGIAFGPLYGRRRNVVNPKTKCLFHIFDDEGSYIDCTNENESNWMSLVQPATCLEDQNLICFEVEKNIFFVTIKEIKVDEELKVWYAPHYGQKMDMRPLGPRSIKSGRVGNTVANAAPQAPQIATEENEVQRWNCTPCTMTFFLVTEFAKHLIAHCEDLRNTCAICKFKYQTFEECLEHDKQMHTVEERAQKGVQCAICPSEFSHVEYMYQHLKEHAGEVPEFKCFSCQKIFNNYDDLQAHSCTLVKDVKCIYCSHMFVNEKGLKRHLQIACKLNPANELRPCKFCGKVFQSRSDLRLHSCSEIPFICTVCNKKFARSAYLARHMKLHHGDVNIEAVKQENSSNVQQENGNREKKTNGAKRRKRDRMSQCKVCNKKFYSLSSFKQHELTHTDLKLQCSTCGQQCMDEKSYESHILSHEQNENDQSLNNGENQQVNSSTQPLYEGKKYPCPFCAPSVQSFISSYPNDVRIHCEDTHAELKQLWDTPDFLENLNFILDDAVMETELT